MNDSISITELTRRNIFDEITVAGIDWSGRVGESAFLARIFDLDSLPSNDHRCSSAAGDIAMHREHFRDWEDDWVFSDSRFDLMRTDDDILLKFLCEMIHPVVILSEENVSSLLSIFNDHLRPDGWELYPCDDISGRPIFAARRLIEGAAYSLKQAKQVAEILSGSYISQQISRMESAVEGDPELAIGTAKEFIETISKTILDKLQIAHSKDDELPRLVKRALHELKLTPDEVPDSAKASETIKRVLGNLTAIPHGIAELRNPYGSGHGKSAHVSGLSPRHARLVVGAATTLCVFMFDTYRENFVP